MNPSLASRTIGLFGGTFDPIHRGHIHLASLARDALELEEIRFLPCRKSPHKPGAEPTPAADRLEMVRLATADLPWAVADDSELRRPGPSFSFQTAREMTAKFPAARLFWIMGSDQWDALLRWERPDELARLVEFAVLARGNSPQPREGYRLHIIPGDHPASATEIRQAKAPAAHPWLSPAVADYIHDHGLYRD